MTIVSGSVCLLSLAALHPHHAPKNLITLEAGVNPAKIDRTATWAIARKEVVSDKPSKNYSVIWRQGPRGDIALTIDDGPHPNSTPQLIQILKKYRVPATFFVVGKQVDRYPWLVQEESTNGFTVGNHSYSHVTFTKLSTADCLAELRATDNLIFQLTGKRPRYFRPPGGDIDPHVMRLATTEGLTTVLWTDDPGDYLSPGDKVIISRTMRSLGKGHVLLLHDGADETLKILPTLIQDIRKMGYRFVPLSDLRPVIKR